MFGSFHIFCITIDKKLKYCFLLTKLTKMTLTQNQMIIIGVIAAGVTLWYFTKNSSISMERYGMGHAKLNKWGCLGMDMCTPGNDPKYGTCEATGASCNLVPYSSCPTGTRSFCTSCNSNLGACYPVDVACFSCQGQ
jgi:hypothetical protein